MISHTLMDRERKRDVEGDRGRFSGPKTKYSTKRDHNMKCYLYPSRTKKK